MILNNNILKKSNSSQSLELKSIIFDVLENSFKQLRDTSEILKYKKNNIILDFSLAALSLHLISSILNCSLADLESVSENKLSYSLIYRITSFKIDEEVEEADCFFVLHQKSYESLVNFIELFIDNYLHTKKED